MNTPASFIYLTRAAVLTAALLVVNISTQAQPATPSAPGAAVSPPPDVSASTVQTPESDSWDLLKDYTYEKREEFASRVARISERYDADIAALKAKRAKMTNDTTDWDFAMKEVVDARADLRYKIDVLAKANTPQTWDDAKGKVGLALDRTRNAFLKVRETTTS